MIFTRDDRENYWQIASLVTQKSLFTVTHALFFISYIFKTIAAHALVPQEAKASADLISTCFFWNIPASALRHSMLSRKNFPLWKRKLDKSS